MTCFSDFVKHITKLWNIATEAFHTEGYREAYIEALRPFLHEDARILDAAAGPFPSLDLLRHGFGTLTCLNGDEDAIAPLVERLAREGYDVPVIHGMWQNLADVVQRPYDTVLVVDNPLPYIDSWNDNPQMVQGDAVLDRVRHVLTQFYNVLSDDGNLVIGLAKNNQRKYDEAARLRGGEPAEVISGMTVADGDGQELKVTWINRYDWSTRLKRSINRAEREGETDESHPMSYLFTNDELVSMMGDVGFSNVQLVTTPDILYDGLVVGNR